MIASKKQIIEAFLEWDRQIAALTDSDRAAQVRDKNGEASADFFIALIAKIQKEKRK